jgi:four helix bundle protein
LVLEAYKNRGAEMAAFSDFEDIEAWKKARLVLKEIYKITKRREFYNDRPMREQIRDSALSVMNNIAEGNDRGGSREFAQFLSVARGSAGETRSMLYAAHDQEYITEKEFSSTFGKLKEISKMLNSLIRYLKNTENTGHKYKQEKAKTTWGFVMRGGILQTSNIKPQT